MGAKPTTLLGSKATEHVVLSVIFPPPLSAIWSVLPSSLPKLNKSTEAGRNISTAWRNRINLRDEGADGTQKNPNYRTKEEADWHYAAYWFQETICKNNRK